VVFLYAADSVTQDGLNAHFARLAQETLSRPCAPPHDPGRLDARRSCVAGSLANVGVRVLRDQAPACGVSMSQRWAACPALLFLSTRGDASEVLLPRA